MTNVLQHSNSAISEEAGMCQQHQTRPNTWFWVRPWGTGVSPQQGSETGPAKDRSQRRIEKVFWMLVSKFSLK